MLETKDYHILVIDGGFGAFKTQFDGETVSVADLSKQEPSCPQLIVANGLLPKLAFAERIRPVYRCLRSIQKLPRRISPDAPVATKERKRFRREAINCQSWRHLGK